MIAVPAGCEDSIAAEFASVGAAAVLTVAGGVTRQDSVRAALKVLPPEADIVLVHDAARPLAPVALIEAVAAAVRAGAHAVVPGLAVDDTIKRIDTAGLVIETPPRHLLRAIQTPQGFTRELLERAHRLQAPEATDDAGLVELLGEPVLVIPGSPEAFKITRPADLARAEAWLAAEREAGRS